MPVIDRNFPPPRSNVHELPRAQRQLRALPERQEGEYRLPSSSEGSPPGEVEEDVVTPQVRQTRNLPSAGPVSTQPDRDAPLNNARRLDSVQQLEALVTLTLYRDAEHRGFVKDQQSRARTLQTDVAEAARRLYELADSMDLPADPDP